MKRRPTPWLVRLLPLLTGLACAACSSVSPVDPPQSDACMAGQRVTCGCIDGRAGTQTCNVSGDGYTPCDCGAADAGPLHD